MIDKGKEPLHERQFTLHKRDHATHPYTLSDEVGPIYHFDDWHEAFTALQKSYAGMDVKSISVTATICV